MIGVKGIVFLFTELLRTRQSGSSVLVYRRGSHCILALHGASDCTARYAVQLHANLFDVSVCLAGVLVSHR